MKVIYSVQVPLGKGFGYTAEKQVEALKDKGYLHQLITPQPNTITDDIAFDTSAAKLLDIDSDVLVCWGNACLEQLKVAKDLGIKTIVNRASTYIEYQDKVLGKEGLKIDPESVKRQIEEYKLADYILVPCEFVKETFPEELKHKIKIIPFGVDIKKFKPRNIKSKKFTVLYCGQNIRRKGFKYLLKAWLDLNLKKAELRITADNPFDVEFFKIKFTGYVDDIVKEYQKASVFCLPSLEEGQALVVLEAMACGTPVIITDHCGYNDILTKQDGFREYKEGDIVDIRDIQALAGRISWYYNHREQCLEKGKAARKLAEKYPWSRFQSEFVKFIKKY